MIEMSISHKDHLIKLSKADQIRVAKILITPPAPTKRFKRAARRYAEMFADKEKARSLRS